jgi:DNA-binding winged helix-turn-helix (wHTH) protein/Tol biopolymer transport system component
MNKLGRTQPMTRLGKTAFFGPFALDLETGELRRDGVRIRLQNQPFQILKKLVEHPGRVVTREDLRHHLWPEDTFVDFESGLNTAANRLRLALSDSAESPKYVETLPRVGYRFIAPVEYQLDAPETDGTAMLPVFATATVAARTVRAEEKRNPWYRFGLAVLMFALGLVTAIGWTHFRSKRTGPVFTQLTFRKGLVDNAQFTPDGEVVYSASWNDDSRHLYLMNVLSPESRQLDFGDARLAAVSRSSQISFLRSAKTGGEYVPELAVAPIYGGAPHAVDRGIEFADWAANGSLCVVRSSPRGRTVEYPQGKILYQTAHWLGRPRVSPDGRSIALIEHALREDDAGYVILVTADGKTRRLSADFASVDGVAWSAKGDEVWFAAARQGINRELYAINLQGQLRRVAAVPAVLDLFDISSSGRVLIGRSVPRLSLYLGDTSTSQVKDISWLDWSRAVAISADGNNVLFDESGEGGGPLYTVYLYRRDRGTTERVGPGRAMDISPNGSWILAGDHSPSSHLMLISADDAKGKAINAPGFTYQNARFIGNTRNIVAQLSRDGSLDELYVQNVDTGALRRLGIPFNYNTLLVSPDGSSAVGASLARFISVINLQTGAKSMVDNDDLSEPVGWAGDKDLVLVSKHGQTLRLEKYNLNSRKRQSAADLPGSLGAGTKFPVSLMISSDLRTFVFSKHDEATGLFAVDGWS